MTGDPHIDARLEPWRPDDHADGLPDPGRERRARIALAVVLLIATAVIVGYLVIAIVGSGVTAAG